MAQLKGLTLSQTLSNAIILHDSVPADYIDKVVNINSTEVLYESAYVSPRPAPKIVLKESWQSRCEDDPQTEERGRKSNIKCGETCGKDETDTLSKVDYNIQRPLHLNEKTTLDKN